MSDPVLAMCPVCKTLRFVCDTGVFGPLVCQQCEAEVGDLVTVKWNPYSKRVKAAAAMSGWITEEVWGTPSENRPCVLLRFRKKGMRKVAVVWEIQDDGKLTCIYARINGTLFSGVQKIAQYLTGQLTEEDVQVSLVEAYEATQTAHDEWEQKRREIPKRFLPKRRTRS